MAEHRLSQQDRLRVRGREKRGGKRAGKKERGRKGEKKDGRQRWWWCGALVSSPARFFPKIDGRPTGKWASTVCASEEGGMCLILLLRTAARLSAKDPIWRASLHSPWSHLDDQRLLTRHCFVLCFVFMTSGSVCLSLSSLSLNCFPCVKGNHKRSCWSSTLSLACNARHLMKMLIKGTPR